MVKNKILGIIQARVSSKRLPGKVLINISGRTVLEHVFNRTSASSHLDEVVIATSTDSSDDLIEDLCAKNKIPCFRGDLEDVLARYYRCALHFKATHIMRITADCPMIDPAIIDAVTIAGVSEHYDCYGISGSFPDGLDCTLLSLNALEIAFKKAQLPSEREHVTPYIEKNHERFKCGSLEMFQNLGTKRWTLDQNEDLEFIKNVYSQLYHSKKPFTTLDVLEYLEQNPEIELINSGIIRNEGYLKSLEKEES